MRKLPGLWLFLGCLSVSLVAPGLTGAPATHAAGSSTLDRPADPVVFTGADVPGLSGVDPQFIVAFRYDGGWQQIPVQVDERAVKDFADIYNYDNPWGGPPVRGITQLVYTDNDTYTGPDPDPTLDDDDEIVFMAKDAGGQVTSPSDPAGVIPGSGIEVTITDPLDAGTGYVYLFRSDGTLTPDAGQQYVSYTFNLLSGEYLDTYDTHEGPNPENSVVTTLYYSHHFSDRWISDEIKITAGAATGVDILDRHKNLFAPGVCARSEDTFSNAEGAFIVNKSGPVRALRSYIGANSGPLTQRENIFYERRQDIRTFLRVHPISGMMDFFDYSPAATGMTYYNDLNTSGVTIDGNPDSVVQGFGQWELATGPQGSLVIAGLLSTDIPGLAYTSYYLDDSTPPVTQCTGDNFAYGSSGLWVDQSIPNTDPRSSPLYNLSGQRTVYYEAPGLTTTDAEALRGQAGTPLTVTSQPWSDSDGDGVPDGLDNCPSEPNPGQENTDAQRRPNGAVPGDWASNPGGDAVGDACDDDDDDDWLTDAGEGAAGTNPLDRDSDDDGVLDGAEVLLGSNPLNGGSKPPGVPASDGDGDGLPASVESLFGSSDAGNDSDGDGFTDGWEVKGYGTSPVSVDSDGDGCEDWIEIVDVNGDRQAELGDVFAVVLRALAGAAGDAEGDSVLDVNKNGAVINDLSDVFLAVLNSNLVKPHGVCGPDVPE